MIARAALQARAQARAWVALIKEKKCDQVPEDVGRMYAEATGVPWV